MKSHFFLIIDFDSTVIKVEGLDELAAISLEHHPEKSQLEAQVRKLTTLGMEGKLEFSESLEQRIRLLHANKDDLKRLIQRLRGQISDSFIRNSDFFRNHADAIYIVSGGFREFICPIIRELGLKPENVYANNFIFDDAGQIIGFDKSNIMAQKGGKVALLKTLNLDGDIYVIGDGYTDYEIKAAGMANRFFAFTENIHRDNVVQAADHITPSFDEFLYLNKLPMAISYPKNRINVLLAGKIPAETERAFQNEGYNVQRLAENYSDDVLAGHLNRTAILGIGRGVRLPKNWLQKAPRLMAIGLFLENWQNLDPQKCLDRGISIFHAKDTHSESVAELVVAAMILLQRKITAYSTSPATGNYTAPALHSGTISGKKLGIISDDQNGAHLFALAELMGMDVCFFDIRQKMALGETRRCSDLNTLLRESNFISIHLNREFGTDPIIGENEMQFMRKDAVLLNFSDESAISLPALKNNLCKGQIQGAALGVDFSNGSDNFRQLSEQFSTIPNVLLLPVPETRRAGPASASAYAVPNQIVNYINTGNTVFSTNFPGLRLPALQNAHRLIHIHQNVPGMLAQINNILAAHSINIIGQYLKTKERIGYVITDIRKEYEPEVIEELKNTPHTIKFRILY